MRTLLMTCGLGLAVIAAPVVAQDTVPLPTAAETAPIEAPKKKKGLLGKIKDIAGDKTVQSVAKMAACTMVPGGQYVAGAIDAASSAADGNAAGTAAGAAGAATGSNCFGGMGGAASTGMVDIGAATAAAMTAGSSSAAPEAGAGSGTDGSQFVMTEKQEKQWIKQMKKAGLTEEQARQQLEVYKQQMAAVGAADDE